MCSPCYLHGVTPWELCAPKRALGRGRVDEPVVERVAGAAALTTAAIIGAAMYHCGVAADIRRMPVRFRIPGDARVGEDMSEGLRRCCGTIRIFCVGQRYIGVCLANRDIGALLLCRVWLRILGLVTAVVGEMCIAARHSRAGVWCLK